MGSDMTKAAAKEVGRFLVSMSQLIDNDERHLIAKIIDLYLKMPSNHKYYFVKYLAELTPIEAKWKERVEDDTEYVNVLREIIWYYSGRAEIGQPCKKELKTHILKYVSHDYCEEALTVKESEGFIEELENL